MSTQHNSHSYLRDHTLTHLRQRMALCKSKVVYGQVSAWQDDGYLLLTFTPLPFPHVRINEFVWDRLEEHLCTKLLDVINTNVTGNLVLACDKSRDFIDERLVAYIPDFLSSKRTGLATGQSAH